MLNELMTQFRLASREIFNHFFHLSNRYENDGWLLVVRFCDVEDVLFQKLVTEPASRENVRYGGIQSGIRVELSTSEPVPVMMNREVDSGYWDHPLKKVTKEAGLAFVRFFDWDQLDYRDNRYVRVQVLRWPSHQEAIGKHALIESQYVKFIVAPKLD